VITRRWSTVCLLDGCIREWARNMAQHQAAFAKKATGKQCTVVRVLDPSALYYKDFE
jgi:hypothetical protein